jgi:glutamyl-tRNA synthetase
MKQQNVRVRFAPSPTGHLHIGGLRTALFNWLFARHHGGSFLLRIEDTDLERSRPEFTDAILEAFAWVGIKSDEPLVTQSQRAEIYAQALAKLLESGWAYRSDPAQEENGKSVIRLRVPRDRKEITFNDLVYGTITFPLDQIDDFVIARSDDSPLYNLVVVVDDIAMKISHIIRADEHIPNTPRQLLLYEALGATPPEFAHVSLILGPGGKPLSKRDASTSVLEYRTDGFLPDALCNYLVRLGWSHGDQEIFSRQELIQAFSLRDINKSGAMFDMEKLRWVNSVYMRAVDARELLDCIVRDVEPLFVQSCTNWSEEQILAGITLYKERVATLKELANVLIHLHTTPQYVSLPAGFQWDIKAVQILKDMAVILEQRRYDWTASAIKTLFDNFCKERSIALPLVAKPVRFALTGLMESPSIYNVIELLGIAETVNRLKAAAFFIENMLKKGV